MYTKLVDNKGITVIEKKPQQSRSLSQQANYIMVDILKSVITGGTGTKAKLGAMPAGGKTGTTNDYTNAWFAGFTPYYSGVFWMGSDDPSFGINKKTAGVDMVGGTVAPIWKEIMLEANKGLPVKDFAKPDGIVTAQISLDSGKAPTDLCYQDPRGNRVVTEIFIKGTEPVELCDAHVAVDIDIRNGKLATEYTPKEYVQRKVFLKRPADGNIPSDQLPYMVPTEYSDLNTAPPAQIEQPPVETPPTTTDGNTTQNGNTGNNSNNGNGNSKNP
jgi:penicillin-binding protein 1A